MKGQPMNLNIKRKLNTVVDHVKANPALYSFIAGATAVTIAGLVYDHKKGVMYPDDLVSRMKDTGKGMYSHNTNTGDTILMTLYNPETMPKLNFTDPI